MKIIRQKKTIIAYNNESALNNTVGTHGHGSMVLSYDRLVEKLGTPTSKGDNYKIQAEWEIITPHGIGTIYDWKEGKNYNGRANGVNKKHVTEWHIGGHNQDTADFIRSLFFK